MQIFFSFHTPFHIITRNHYYYHSYRMTTLSWGNNEDSSCQTHFPIVCMCGKLYWCANKMLDNNSKQDNILLTLDIVCLAAKLNNAIVSFSSNLVVILIFLSLCHGKYTTTHQLNLPLRQHNLVEIFTQWKDYFNEKIHHTTNLVYTCLSWGFLPLLRTCH